ncbi:MerR family transcriptional regulator [Sporosarcina sp. SAFN-010]|uniref:MerR family transcriptional regulator n=1 Tax=Sporosarcina sp. SAFN-010 TaxID=3387273 RepID=UPI003F81A057
MTEHIATYSVKQASQAVGISVGTVRRYAGLLELHGYWINRDEQNARLFCDADLNAMKLLRKNTEAGRTLQLIARDIAVAQKEPKVFQDNRQVPSDKQAIRKLESIVSTLVEKVDELLNVQEDTRQDINVALLKIEKLKAEKEELFAEKLEWFQKR